MGAKDERLAGKASFPFRPGTMASRKKTLVISDGPYSEIEKQTGCDNLKLTHLKGK
jgi:hypothetical protein